MLKRFYAIAAAKRATIFLAAFVVTGIWMGNWYANVAEHTLLQAVAPVQEQRRENTLPNAKPAYPGRLEMLEKPPENPPDGTEQTLQPVVPVAQAQQTHVPDKPPQAAGFVYVPDIPMQYELQRYTYDRCEQLGLDYALVLALMWRESRFQVNAVNINTNGTQDSGIMQINDVNRSWLLEKHGIHDLMDPVQNINAGTAMLSDFMAKYGEHDALMAYQYGEQGMRKKKEQGVYTNDKIALLLRKREEFQTLLQSAAVA